MRARPGEFAERLIPNAGVAGKVATPWPSPNFGRHEAVIEQILFDFLIGAAKRRSTSTRCEDRAGHYCGGGEHLTEGSAHVPFGPKPGPHCKQLHSSRVTCT